MIEDGWYFVSGFVLPIVSGNLITALDVKVDRVGHALELVKDPELMTKSVQIVNVMSSECPTLTCYRYRTFDPCRQCKYSHFSPCHLDAMKRYREAGIHIEANPISNTKWLPGQDMSKHPLRPFQEAGLSVGINSDNYLLR